MRNSVANLLGIISQRPDPLMLLITMTLLLSSCAKYRLDAQVRELCAKDGGIKVYETVKLPPDKFNRWGQINFYHPTRRENALGPEYLFKEYTHYYLKGNFSEPAMRRVHYQVIRRSDAKLLGELIGYSRRGGDLLSPPFQPSAFRCPDGYGDTVLLKQIFKKILIRNKINEYH